MLSIQAMIVSVSAGVASAAVLPSGTVGFQLGVFSANNDFIWANQSVSYGPGTTSASIGTPAAGFLSDIRVDVTTTQIDATTRSVTYDIVSTDPTGLLFPAGSLTLDGEQVEDIAFSFGMDLFGPFPGAANDPFFDAELVDILSTSGNLFSLDGTPFVTGGGAGLFTEPYGPGEFGGRVFYSGGADGPTAFPLSRGTATIVYSIVPAPAAGGALVLGGLVAARRRR